MINGIMPNKNAITGCGTKGLSVNSQFEDLTLPLNCLGATGTFGGINFRYYQTAGYTAPQAPQTKSFIPVREKKKEWGFKENTDNSIFICSEPQ